MTHPMVSTGNALLRSTVFCFALLVLAGCSSTKMAYRYADWGVVWWVEDYVTLTDTQKTRLYQDLDDFRTWHCATELPRYRRWLDNVAEDVQQKSLSAHTLADHQQQLQDFFSPLVDRTIPIASRLLASLSDAQVRELSESIARRQQEMRDEYLSEDPAATAEARAERSEERLQRWFGDLNDDQQAIVKRWSEQRDGQTEIWLQGRRNWQLALMEALEHRREPGFSNRIAQLLHNSERVRGEEYQAMMARSRAALNELIHDMVMASDPGQLAHLKKRTVALKEDFQALTCSPGPEVANR